MENGTAQAQIYLEYSLLCLVLPFPAADSLMSFQKQVGAQSVLYQQPADLPDKILYIGLLHSCKHHRAFDYAVILNYLSFTLTLGSRERS